MIRDFKRDLANGKLLAQRAGRHRYRESMLDLFEMMQSPTFCAQMGYTVVEVVLGALFPEYANHVAAHGSAHGLA